MSSDLPPYAALDSVINEGKCVGCKNEWLVNLLTSKRGVRMNQAGLLEHSEIKALNCTLYLSYDSFTREGALLWLGFDILISSEVDVEPYIILP